METPAHFPAVSNPTFCGPQQKVTQANGRNGMLRHADDNAPGMTPIEHNQQISSLLGCIRESESYRAAARTIHECFREVMARLLTRQLAVKSYERGNEYA